MAFEEVIIGNARLILGDCREVLPTLGPVSAVVTDPPYGIKFMGKRWDYDVPSTELWARHAELAAHVLNIKPYYAPAFGDKPLGPTVKPSEQIDCQRSLTHSPSSPPSPQPAQASGSASTARRYAGTLPSTPPQIASGRATRSSETTGCAGRCSCR